MNQGLEEKIRNNNIDCLKCLLMLGVMALHTVIHGFGFAKSLHSGEYVWNGGQSLFELFVMCIANVSVNVYFLISGYYGIRYKRKRALQFIEIMFFYSLLTYIISVCIGIEVLGLVSIIKHVLLGWRSYWFMVVYLIIYVFSDVINNALDNLDEAKWIRFLSIYFVFNTTLGFILNCSEYGSALSTLPMLFLYCCGYYLRHSDANRIGKWWIYVFSTIINFFICLMLILIHQFNWAYDFSVDYCNPFIVISSLSLFSIVVNLKQTDSKLGRFAFLLAPYTLAVYLMTETVVARKYVYWGLPFFQSVFGGFSIIIYSLCLYIISISVEVVRIKLLAAFRNKNG